MPRIGNHGSNVDQYCQTTFEGSSTFDVCQQCYDHNDCNKPIVTWMSSGKENNTLYPYNGDPYGDSVEIIDYDMQYHILNQEDEDSYTCDLCNKLLTSED